MSQVSGQVSGLVSGGVRGSVVSSGGAVTPPTPANARITDIGQYRIVSPGNYRKTQ